jgi:hypothetical protein
MLSNRYQTGVCPLPDIGYSFPLIRRYQASTACPAANSVRAKVNMQHLEQWRWQGRLTPWEETRPKRHFAHRQFHLYSSGVNVGFAIWQCHWSAAYIVVSWWVTDSSWLSSSYCWAPVANAPNVLQPYWLIVLPLDVPALTTSLLLPDPSGQRWNYI